jgi:hypothetical protein
VPPSPPPRPDPTIEIEIAGSEATGVCLRPAAVKDPICCTVERSDSRCIRFSLPSGGGPRPVPPGEYVVELTNTYTNAPGRERLTLRPGQVVRKTFDWRTGQFLR